MSGFLPNWGGGGSVPGERQVNAGEGLTGGGNLLSDVTINVGNSPDGSIIINPDNIEVGTLSSDAQHGERGGGSNHALATESTHGFMSLTDKQAIVNQIPTENEKAALAGTVGSPSITNKYVTESDPAIAPRYHTITVAPTGEYASVKLAVESITGASELDQYAIYIAPGTYYEYPFVMKPYISIIGKGGHGNSITVATLDNYNNFIKGSYASSLIDVDIIGPTDDECAAIWYEDNSTIPFKIDHCTIKDGYYGILVNSSGTGVVQVFNTSISITNTMNSFLKTTNGIIEASGCAIPGGTCNNGFFAEGSGATLSLTNCYYNSAAGTNGVYINDGSFATLNGCVFSNGTNAIHIGSAGTATEIFINSCIFIHDNFTWNILADTNTCTIAISSSVLRRDLVSVPSGTNFNGTFVDENHDSDPGCVVKGELWCGPISYSIPLVSYTKSTGSTGVATGGEVSRISGLDVSIEEGYGFIDTGAILKRITWPTTTLTLSPNQQEIYIVCDTDGYFYGSPFVTTPYNSISFGIAATDETKVTVLGSRNAALPQPIPSSFIYARDVVGPISVSGTAASKHDSVSLQLDVDSGSYYIYNVPKSATANSPITFTYWHRDSYGNWEGLSEQTAIDPDGYDAYNYTGSGTIADVPGGKFKRDLLYLTTNGETEYHIVYSQQIFDSIPLAINNPNPPGVFNNIALRLAGIIVEGHASDIGSIVDQRPKLGQLASPGTTITDHGSLSGLSDNDHPQYQLRTEKNLASGYCGLDGSAKVAAGQLNLTATPPTNVTKSAAATGSSSEIARSDHKHDITTAAPSTIGTANSEGNATSLARSNHVHSHGNQVDGYLHQLVTTGLPGFMDGEDKRKLDGLFASVFPENVTKEDAVLGIATSAARADHKHNIFTEAPTTIGTANSEGDAYSLARSNHVHSHGNQIDGYLHQLATTGLPGFMNGTDKRKLDNLITNAVPNTTQVIAGDGLTGGGTLSGNITLSVVANVDSSIKVNANDIQVGVLASDSQHGNRGNGDLHSAVTSSKNGFMIASDKVKFDGYLPTEGEKDALAGSFGTPSGTNRYITEDDPRYTRYHIISVAPQDADFTSVGDAVNSIVSTSESDQYAIYVYPAVYEEDPFTLKPYVSIIGKGGHNFSVVLETKDNNNHFITGAYASSIIDVDITGPTGSGYAAIDYTDDNVLPFRIDNVVISDAYYGMWCHPSTFGIVQMFNVGFRYKSSNTERFAYVSDHGLLTAFSAAITTNTPGSCLIGFYASGSSAKLTMDSCSYSIPSGNIGVFLDDGAIVRATGVSFGTGTTAIHIGSSGSNTEFTGTGCTIYNTFTNDMVTDTPNCTINFTGHAHRSKLSIATGTNFVASFSDDTNSGQEGQVVLGELWVGDTTVSIPLKSYTQSTASSGLSSGGDVSRTSGLGISVAEGYGFINDGTDVIQIHWVNQPLTLSKNKTQIWIVVDETNTVSEVFSLPNDESVVTLATAITGNTEIWALATRSAKLTQPIPSRFKYSRDVVGPISVSGTMASKHDTISLEVNVDSGTYYIYDNIKTATANSPITFTYWHRDSYGNWEGLPGQTAIDPDGYDAYSYTGSGTIAAVPSTKFKRDLLYLAVNGSETEYHVVYGQEIFDSVPTATNNPSPPSQFNNIALRIAGIITQENVSDIASVIDQRPRLGQFAATTTSITRHGDLQGLSADDHKQYQLRTEKNLASGYCGLDGSAKVAASQLNLTSTPPLNVTKSAAATGSSSEIARSDHKHDITTATPSTIGTANSEGDASSLARSNHIHSHGSQTDGSLHATATTIVNGFMSASDKTKLDSIPGSVVPTTRQIVSGSGLTGGGDLSSDRTINVVANADGSITVNADDIQVGILATDIQHGNRGGGTQHSAATTVVNGFMSSTDKSKLDGISSGATNTPLSSTTPADVTKAAAAIGIGTTAARADHKHDISTAAPASGAVAVNNSATEGSATSLSRSDHIHAVAAGSPVSVGTANSAGTATTFNRSDHVHSGLTRGAADFTTFTQKTTLVSGDRVLIEDSEAAQAKKYSTLGDMISSVNPFGKDYQLSSSEGTSNTTSSTYQNKVSLTTGSLTGTYRVSYYCELTIGTANRDAQVRLYNSTDATELCMLFRRFNQTTENVPAAGFQYVTFTGAAKTFIIQYNSPNNVAQVNIQRARIELWRVS